MNVASYEEALQTTLQLAIKRQVVPIDVSSRARRYQYLAKPAYAAIDLPNFSRAMMDGYAVHRDDLNANHPLTVNGDVRAGDIPSQAVSPGFVTKIRTGAPVPFGTSAIVRKEWIEEVDDTSIRILQSVRDGESVQLRGEDARCGDVILAEGKRLNGQARTLLQAAGVKSVEVYQTCRITIICTGSELVQGTDELKLGEVYAASDAFLIDGLTEMGATIEDVVFVGDSETAIESAILRYIGNVDYLFITGGASVGDTDFVKTVLYRITGSASLNVERVLMRPGSPYVATHVGDTTIFGLSGNPAACFVQFHVLAKHAVQWTLGQSRAPFSITVELSENISVKPVKHVRFYRASVRCEMGRFVAYPQFRQSSGILSGLPSVNAIIRLDKSLYQKGEHVPAILITAEDDFS